MAALRCTNPASSARVFVQLSMRRTPAPSPLLLDVLLPPQTRARHFSTELARSSSRALKPRSSAPTTAPLPTAQQHFARRAFATTSRLQRTEAIFNPQADDDGNPMVLEITPRAAKRLSQIMKKDENPDLALRIQVESGGCHGFQYLMSLTTLPHSLPGSQSSTPEASAPEPPAAAEVEPSTTTNVAAGTGIGEDDTIFAFLKEDAADEAANSSATTVPPLPKIILDGPSLELLQGSKVDFTMELIGSQFKIVDNPHASSSCGCGTSFDIKV